LREESHEIGEGRLGEDLGDAFRDDALVGLGEEVEITEYGADAEAAGKFTRSELGDNFRSAQEVLGGREGLKAGEDNRHRVEEAVAKERARGVRMGFEETEDAERGGVFDRVNGRGEEMDEDAGHIAHWEIAEQVGIAIDKGVGKVLKSVDLGASFRGLKALENLLVGFRAVPRSERIVGPHPPEEIENSEI
jgi:hypothetical protein